MKYVLTDTVRNDRSTCKGYCGGEI